MLGFIASLIGAYIFYAQSKCFPAEKRLLKNNISPVVGYVLLIASVVYYCLQYSVGKGLQYSVILIPLAYCMVILLFNLPKAISVFLSFLIIVYTFIYHIQ